MLTATIEPLHEHIDHYRLMLLSNLGMGVQAHYRGPRIYDTDGTREMVKSCVEWYKQYRDILESDIVHGRRADGRDLDWILHVNPRLNNRGMLCVYNPLSNDVTKTIRVNLYYTGLSGQVEVGSEDGTSAIHDLNGDYSIELEVSVPAKGMSWYVVRSAAPELISFSDKQSIIARVPIVIAHRGGVVSPRSPECSLTAIRLAAEMGYDMVELDVQRSRDGVPIVFHDRTLTEACDRNGRVADFTATELEAIPYTKGSDRIVRLATALESCRRLGLGIMLDLKDGRDAPDFLATIDRLIVANELDDAAISFSGSDAARRVLQHVRFTPTDDEMSRLRTGESMDLTQRFWFGIPRWLQPGDLKRLKAAGALVIPAINTFRYPENNHFNLAKDDIERLTAEGADGFQIDSVYYSLLE